jgi:integrase
MASIREREGKYQVLYRDPAGRQRSETFTRRSDAKAFKSSVETDLRRGDYRDPTLGLVTLETWATEWLRTAIHLKPKTVEGYESLLRKHILPRFGTTPLARITTPETRAWLSSLPLSPSRGRQAYRLLSTLMKAAVESGNLARSPCIGIKVAPVPPRELTLATPAEVDRLAAAVPDPYRTLIYVLAYGGIRWGEACALRRRRCDILRSRIEVVQSLSEVKGQPIFGPTKTYSRRWVKLPRSTSELLAEHIARYVQADPEALVFTAPKGGHIRGPNFRRRVWAPAIGKAGLPPGFHMHDLRHFCGIDLDQPRSVRQSRQKPARAQQAHGHARYLHQALPRRPREPVWRC